MSFYYRLLLYLTESEMDDWVMKDFKKTGRPKTLILIGDTGLGNERQHNRNLFATLSEPLAFSHIGKTTFAMSLFGTVNHYRGKWSAAAWNDSADYMVIDDVPWDLFEKRGFPDKGDLLTGQDHLYVIPNRSTYHSHPYISLFLVFYKCHQCQISDRKEGRINTLMPAIVLMNLHHAGSLLNQPIVNGVLINDPFWSKRAFVYVMSNNEKKKFFSLALNEFFISQLEPGEYFHNPDMVDNEHVSDIQNVSHREDIAAFQRDWLEARAARMANSTSLVTTSTMFHQDTIPLTATTNDVQILDESDGQKDNFHTDRTVDTVQERQDRASHKRKLTTVPIEESKNTKRSFMKLRHPSSRKPPTNRYR